MIFGLKSLNYLRYFLSCLMIVLLFTFATLLGPFEEKSLHVREHPLDACSK